MWCAKKGVSRENGVKVWSRNLTSHLVGGCTIYPLICTSVRLCGLCQSVSYTVVSTIYNSFRFSSARQVEKRASAESLFWRTGGPGRQERRYCIGFWTPSWVFYAQTYLVVRVSVHRASVGPLWSTPPPQPEPAVEGSREVADMARVGGKFKTQQEKRPCDKG